MRSLAPGQPALGLETPPFSLGPSGLGPLPIFSQAQPGPLPHAGKEGDRGTVFGDYLQVCVEVVGDRC